MAATPLTIACFGEALWDILPRGIFPGGAPLNTAYHLTRQGLEALPISAVGNDFLGQELLRRLAGWKIESRHVARLSDEPTGTVRAELDKDGNATYIIARNVAWDHIPVSKALLRRWAPAAIVFGSLALREISNRRTLDTLLDAWPDAVRVLDVNLRRPFDEGRAIDFALRRGQLVKLNADELTKLVEGTAARGGSVERAARRLARRHDLTRVCVSAGSRGAGLLWHDTWFWENARPVVVRDTIGAGDAFLAALLAALFSRRASPAAALAAACRMGEFVAACDGATPTYGCSPRGRPRSFHS